MPPPFRIRPLDLIFYDNSTEALKFVSNFERTALLVFKIQRRSLASSSVLEESLMNFDEQVFTVSKGAIKLVPQEKASIDVIFTPPYANSYFTGKLLITAIDIESEEELGSYQVPLLGISGICSVQVYPLPMTERQGFVLVNRGTGPAFASIKFSSHANKPTENFILGPDESKMYSIPYGVRCRLIYGPLLLKFLLPMYENGSFSISHGLQSVNYNGHIAELLHGDPKTFVGSPEVLESYSEMAKRVYMAYVTMTFRSDPVLFLNAHLKQFTIGSRRDEHPDDDSLLQIHEDSIYLACTACQDSAVESATSLSVIQNNNDHGTVHLADTVSMPAEADVRISHPPQCQHASIESIITSPLHRSISESRFDRQRDFFLDPLINIPIADRSSLYTHWPLMPRNGRERADRSLVPEEANTIGYTHPANASTTQDTSNHSYNISKQAALTQNSHNDVNLVYSGRPEHNVAFLDDNGSERVAPAQRACSTPQYTDVHCAVLNQNQAHLTAMNTTAERFSDIAQGVQGNTMSLSGIDSVPSAREVELMEQYNRHLSDLTELTEKITSNQKTVNNIVDKYTFKNIDAPYALEQDFAENIPDLRATPLRFAECTLSNNSQAYKRDSGNTVVYENQSSLLSYWRILNDSFLINGSCAHQPYFEKIGGVTTTAAIAYMTGCVTIENNSNQSGFYEDLMTTPNSERKAGTSGPLTVIDCLDDDVEGAEELAYLYYTLAFVTSKREYGNMRIMIKADKPLYGRLAPGEQETIAITIGVPYTDIESTRLPELPAFFQSLLCDNINMTYENMSSPIFLRVFGVRFDRLFSTDEMETLPDIATRERGSCNISIRQCVDLPVKWLNGCVVERLPAAKHMRLQNSSESIHNPRLYTEDYRIVVDTKHVKRTQCLNIEYLKFLGAIPRVDILTGNSVTLAPIRLALFPRKQQDKEASHIEEQNLHAKRRARNMLSGSDVMLISPMASRIRNIPFASSKPRSKSTYADDTDRQGRATGAKKSESVSARAMKPADRLSGKCELTETFLPVKAIPGNMLFAEMNVTRIGLSVVPVSTPIVDTYVDEVASRLEERTSDVTQPMPVLTSVFSCSIASAYQPLIGKGGGSTSIKRRVAGPAGGLPMHGTGISTDGTEIIIDVKRMASAANVTASSDNTTGEFVCAHIKFTAEIPWGLIKRLIMAISHCRRRPVFIEQKYELVVRSIGSTNEAVASFPFTLRAPVVVDPTAMHISGLQPPQEQLGDRNDGSKTLQPHDAALTSASIMALNILNVNGFADGVWSDTSEIVFPPCMAGSTISESFILHNASDKVLVVFFSNISRPFSILATSKIAPYSSLEIPVHFAPKVVGRYTANLTVAYYDVMGEAKARQKQRTARTTVGGVSFMAGGASSSATKRLDNQGSMQTPSATQQSDTPIAGAIKQLTDAVDSALVSSATTQNHSLALAVADDQKIFRIKLSGSSVFTPIVVTQPQSQLTNAAMLAVNTIAIPLFARIGRIFISNISNVAVKYDVATSTPTDDPSKPPHPSMRSLIVTPAQGIIEPKRQCVVSISWDKSCTTDTVVPLYIYTESRNPVTRDLMHALSFKGVVKCIQD